jgi:hypothetical protein
MNVSMPYRLPRDIAAVGAHIEACHFLIRSPDSRLQHAHQLIGI